MSTQEKWDRRFLALAEHIASWSKDPSTKVGAVLVNDDGIVVGLGYNGFARGVEDTDERLNDRETKYAFVVHAEVNAILMAGDKAKGCTLYVWPSFSIPCICHDCCKTAIQAGVKEIVGLAPTPEYAERAKRWQDSIDKSRQMCVETGTAYRQVEIHEEEESMGGCRFPDCGCPESRLCMMAGPREHATFTYASANAATSLPHTQKQWDKYQRSREILLDNA